MTTNFAEQLRKEWQTSPRWKGVDRPYKAEDVVRLRGTVHIEHSLARLGAEKLWRFIHEKPFVNALGALTGNQAMQQVKAGLDAIYLSGWQVAGDANLSGEITEVPPEGSLLPETFIVQRGASRQSIVDNMQAEARKLMEKAWAQRQKGLPVKTWQEAIVLASIVEKESVPGPERPLIAGVYRNRLKRGMRLQSDPTVIYGVLMTQGVFDGNLKVVDLRADNPWNTYTRAGLPPSPIANPSLDAIRATLYPANVPYLYFVSRNDGTHVFSATLTEHNRAVKRYQMRRQAKNEVGTKHGKHR